MNFQNNRVFQKFQKQVKRIVATPEAKNERSRPPLRLLQTLQGYATHYC